MSEQKTAQKNLNRMQALLYLVLTAVLWSTSGLLIKMVNCNPIALAGIRSFFAAILMWGYVKKPKLNRSGWQWGAAAAYAATVILFVLANKMTTSANAILLQYTAPIYVVLFARVFLGERTNRIDWVTIIVVFLGMGLFFKEELAPGAFWGNVVAVLSGIAFALTAVLLRKQKGAQPVESVLLGNMITAVFAIPWLFQGSLPDAKGWLVLIFMGLFQIGLSYILYSIALQHVSAIEGVLVPLIEPILNPVWVLIFTGEKPGVWALLGGVIVLAAVTTRSLLLTVRGLKYKKNNHQDGKGK
ncbi:MAG TPA: EamA family transporter [Firmicutes bacterium]|jgi:drug/metabolite transporter (DMT)-like permease|nr:EamA family transporter [Bacillota bacterium]